MEVTAQRVRSLRGGEGAIHTFYYWHGAPLPRTQDGRLDLSRSSDARILMRQQVLVHVGGNVVDSYLDVTAEDETTSGTLNEAIVSLLDDLPPHNPFQVTLGDVRIEYYVSPRITQTGRSVGQEIEQLWQEARALLEQPVVQAILTVLMDESPEQTIFQLDASSIQRIQHILGADWTAPRLSIDESTRKAFEATHGSIYEHLAPVLTGLDTTSLRGLGGIQFLDQRTGKKRYELV